VSRRAGLDAMEKRMMSCPCRKSNPGFPAPKPSLYLLSFTGSYVIYVIQMKVCTYRCVNQYIYMLTITNMETMQDVEAKADNVKQLQFY
jgi:hypothetical protein